MGPAEALRAEDRRRRESPPVRGVVLRASPAMAAHPEARALVEDAAVAEHARRYGGEEGWVVGWLREEARETERGRLPETWAVLTETRPYAAAFCRWEPPPWRPAPLTRVDSAPCRAGCAGRDTYSHAVDCLGL